MNNIIISDVTAEHIPAIKDIVREVWDWEDAFASDDIVDACVAIYFAPVLHDATFGRVALLNGKAVGVIFGTIDGEMPCYKHLLEDITPYIITMMQANENDRQIMCEYMTKQYAVYEELIDEVAEEYDGALDFLVLSNAAQGRGIGKQLWLVLKAYLEEKNVSKVYVYSDNKCNFGFYESQGFTRRGKKDMCIVFDGEEERTEQYLYEYRVQESGGRNQKERSGQ